MAQLILAEIPGVVDLPDSTIAADQPLTDYSIQKISNNAKFGAVRCEIIFMGFYHHGDTVLTPISPVDGYAYARGEVQYLWTMYSNRAPGAGFVAGQQAPPSQASAQTERLYNFPGPWDINDATGLVSLRTTYWNGSTETVTNDGIIKVYAMCQRLSVNAAN